jgi:hypothetical protein
MGNMGITRTTAQAGLEYITTIGFAFIIIAIVIGIIYFYYTSTQSVANTCVFNYGIYCNDFLIGTPPGTSNSLLALYMSNMQNYPVADPSLIANVSGKNVTGQCFTNYALPGGAIICNATLPNALPDGTNIAGKLYVKSSLCPNGNAITCNSQPREIYSGTFSAHSTTLSTNEQIAISVTETQLPIINSSKVIKITSTVKLFGTSVPGATIQLSANVPSIVITPSSGTTDTFGNVTSYMVVSKSQSSNVLVQATFGSASNSITV